MAEHESDVKYTVASNGSRRVIRFIMLLVAIGLVALIIWGANSAPSNEAGGGTTSAQPAAPSSSRPRSSAQEKRGEVIIGPNKKSTYYIQSQDGDSKYVALFQPHLPRNDGILTTALLQLITDTYGKNTVTNLTPQVVPVNGVNYIAFEGKQGNYYMLVTKEDTGEVNSVLYFRR
jgi:hypothetical protein